MESAHEVRWAIAVIAFFVLCTLVFWGRAKKDMFGAITGAVVVILIASVCIFVSGCEVSPEHRPWLEAGLAYDRSGTVGSNPACVVRIREAVIPERIVVGFEHHSSCADQNDRGEINQLEIMAIIPLGRSK